MTVTSLILGLDVSPKRCGWGLVNLIDGAPVACGMEPIDLPDHGWQHEQVAKALRVVAVTAGGMWTIEAEIQAVYIEEPISRFPGMAYKEGRAIGCVQAEVERRWPWAPIAYLVPAEWRKLAGLKGNASKTEVWARAAASMSGILHVPDLPQDAADALLIAVAGWHRNEDTMARAKARA